MRDPCIVYGGSDPLDLFGPTSSDDDRSTAIDVRVGNPFTHTAATAGDYHHLVGHIEQLRHSACT